jgi:hypothetical protein
MGYSVYFSSILDPAAQGLFPFAAHLLEPGQAATLPLRWDKVRLERWPMARGRPTLITVLAVFQIVLGASATLCDLVGSVQAIAGETFAFPTGTGQAQLTREEAVKVMRQQCPAQKLFQTGAVLTSLVLSLLMLTSGIALLGMRPWGRVLALGTALGILLLKIAELVDMFVVVLPVMRQVAETARQREGMEAFAAPLIPLFGYGSILAKLYTIPYHVVVVVLLLLPATAAAFGQGRTHPSR